MTLSCDPVEPSPRFDGVSVTPDGRAIFSGVPLQLLSRFEARFRDMALASGAQEHVFPSLIQNETLRCAGYFKSFPEGATSATAPGLAHDCSDGSFYFPAGERSPRYSKAV